MPENMMKPVVADIFHGDEVTDFNLAKANGIIGVIHKATEGTTVRDKKYEERRREAEAAGLLWGAYHFATPGDVEQQVENFLAHAEPDDKTLLALDWEPHKTGTMSLADAKKFLTLVAARTGRRPALYSGSTAKEALNGKPDPFLAQHRLWLCQYGPRPKLPPGWESYWLWQYTGDGEGLSPHTVPGIPGAGGLDLNVYGGNVEQLAAEWAGPPVTEPPPAGAGAPEAANGTTRSLPSDRTLKINSRRSGTTGRYLLAMILAIAGALLAVLFISSRVATWVVAQRSFSDSDSVADLHALVFMGMNLVGLLAGWIVGWWLGGSLSRPERPI